MHKAGQAVLQKENITAHKVECPIFQANCAIVSSEIKTRLSCINMVQLWAEQLLMQPVKPSVTSPHLQTAQRHNGESFLYSGERIVLFLKQKLRYAL